MSCVRMLLITAVMLVVSGLVYRLRGRLRRLRPRRNSKRRDQALQGRGPWGGRGLFKVISTAVLFIVLPVCYAVWQRNPDSPQPSQSDQVPSINP